MPKTIENDAIKIILDNNIISSEEYKILFCSKEEWFTVNNLNEQDWTISIKEQIKFWEAFEKIKIFFEDMAEKQNTPIMYDFSFIKFPVIKMRV